MNLLECSGIWTGCGGLQGPARIRMQDGVIVSIESCEDTGIGAWVIPSFVDAHCHFLWSGLESCLLNLGEADSARRLIEMVKAAASDMSTGWILRGFGYDNGRWPDSSLPSLQQLDDVCPRRPLFLRRVCGHEALLNSAMLRLLPPNSPGVDYSAGVLREGMIFDFETLFPPEEMVLKKALESACGMALREGVTAVRSFETMPGALLLRERELPVRTAVCLFGRDAGFLEDTGTEELERFLGCREDESWFRAGIKFFLDGSIGAATAAMTVPYRNGEEVQPILCHRDVSRAMDFARKLGLPPVFHAIGGLALQQIQRASEGIPKSSDLPVMVEHAEEFLACDTDSWDRDIHTFVMQPNFVNRWQMPGGLYERKLSLSTARSLNPFSAVLKSGFRLAFGSDGMPFGPLRGLAGATEHPAEEFSIGAIDALEAYTLNAAAASGLHDLALPLASGRRADMTVLSANPVETPWSDIEIQAVVVGGETAFGNSGLVKEMNEDR